MKTVNELSGERVRLRAGTLYAALDRPTDDGAARLSAEVQHLRAAAAVAATRLRRRGTTRPRPAG